MQNICTAQSRKFDRLEGETMIFIAWLSVKTERRPHLALHAPLHKLQAPIAIDHTVCES